MSRRSGRPTSPVRCESLERRALFAAAPSDVLTKAVRQDLLNHWNGSNKSTLQADLTANNLSAFDTHLLSYMTARAGQSFFWKTSDVAGIKSFINTNLATSGTISNADHIVSHMF